MAETPEDIARNMDGPETGIEDSKTLSKVVLSVEGNAFINKGTWTTHEIIGVYDNRDLAMAAYNNRKLPEEIYGEESIVILTDFGGGSSNVTRIA